MAICFHRQPHVNGGQAEAARDFDHPLPSSVERQARKAERNEIVMTLIRMVKNVRAVSCTSVQASSRRLCHGVTGPVGIGCCALGL